MIVDEETISYSQVDINWCKPLRTQVDQMLSRASEMLIL